MKTPHHTTACSPSTLPRRPGPQSGPSLRLAQVAQYVLLTHRGLLHFRAAWGWWRGSCGAIVGYLQAAGMGGAELGLHRLLLRQSPMVATVQRAAGPIELMLG